mmetsp:Transcript_21879/g.35407  ORF Transcript_21879/g.35407 Transcript_21879/m.35407 type:complete len:115 (+) Transcript_21879:1419-1763(+)|eukprot:CAMPEP_0194704900 /NCGR_PEP_ID=MMETSP0295-20121207/28590_1 /TAXON_ID=39354 /ORGANISM="Heterosigma akashiwo, Strain CCMP2393" /LENGTH=114 /DNA_ID=CAMNT_0039600437 /DNA_START=441 /DNA_END=785 /DNA_ORIENTATION=+
MKDYGKEGETSASVYTEMEEWTPNKHRLASSSFKFLGHYCHPTKNENDTFGRCGSVGASAGAPYSSHPDFLVCLLLLRRLHPNAKIIPPPLNNNITPLNNFNRAVRIFALWTSD